MKYVSYLLHLSHCFTVHILIVICDIECVDKFEQISCRIVQFEMFLSQTIGNKTKTR